MCNAVLSLQGKRLRLPSGAKVKNESSYTYTASVCLNGMYRDNFTFTNFTLT